MLDAGFYTSGLTKDVKKNGEANFFLPILSKVTILYYSDYVIL